MAVSLDDFLSDKASTTLAGGYLNVTTNHDGFTTGNQTDVNISKVPSNVGSNLVN